MHDSTLLVHTDKYIFEEQNYVLFGKTKDQSRKDNKRIDIFREKNAVRSSQQTHFDWITWRKH